MPELPEVESARAVIEAGALDREVADVDDTDTWVCRPHATGEIRSALVGRRLTVALRRGKSMWCETSSDGPVLGIHLGMSGRIVVTDPSGDPVEGGDRVRGLTATSPDRDLAWDRFTIRFADGGELRLFDKRRLGRVRLDPDLDRLGPDAAEVGVAEFRSRVGRGTAPVKARLLDQSVIAGVGNLLADETLWQAAVDPRRRVDTLDHDTLTALHRSLRKATRAAIRNGGVHTGEVMEHRVAGGHCPRCGAPMQRATVGGRTTWFCSVEQGPASG
ncbi:Fpg/Nei family DNA glycosylase [Nocardioides sediminis]|uniref:Fpg/Nei family DNA glycosylase n=1 Tax=Nocardioides sediminis TaxID=433648 RepID=UPI000D32125D|nr:DNA-formamidopyrimidine glycosylase family protein [Nocardioides sediminis]